MNENDAHGSDIPVEETDAIIISTHDFEEAKGKIKEFTESMPSTPEFKPFPTAGGLFGWFDHNVTGNELNKFVETLEQYLIDFNSRDIQFLKEFHHVYDAFESLDRDYIQAILIAVKSAERASQEAKDAQKEIDVTVDRLCQAIENYKKFKTELESYSHLKDVDKMWNDLQAIKSAISKPEGKMKKKQINHISKYMEQDNSTYDDHNNAVKDLVLNNQKLSRKVNLLTVVSISAIAIAVCEAIFHITGVL